MTQNEKFQIQRRNTLRNLWQKLSGTPDFPVKLVLAALYLMGAAYVCVKQAAWRTLAGNIPLPSPLLKAAMEHALLAYLLAALRRCWRSCSIPLAGGRQKTSFNASGW